MIIFITKATGLLYHSREAEMKPVAFAFVVGKLDFQIVNS